MVSPNLRVVQPKPPPSVRPATPVVELMPIGVARPNFCASLSKSARVAPGSTRAVREAGSTWTDFISERSIKRPPSQTALPAMLWPPPRTARRSFASRASLTVLMTSAAPMHRATTAGRRSIMAFQIVRAASYPSSPGKARVPRILSRKPRRISSGRILVASNVRIVRSVMFASVLRPPSRDLRGSCGFEVNWPRRRTHFMARLVWPLVHELNRPGIDCELGAALRPA